MMLVQFRALRKRLGACQRKDIMARVAQLCKEPWRERVSGPYGHSASQRQENEKPLPDVTKLRPARLEAAAPADLTATLRSSEI